MNPSDLAAAPIVCSTAWSVTTRARGMMCASSSAILRRPASTASRARSMVNSRRTSSSVSNSTPFALTEGGGAAIRETPAGLLQKRFETIQPAGDLLPAGGVGHPHEPLGPERGAGDQVDMGLLQRRQAEAQRVGDGLAAERPPEVAG